MSVGAENLAHVVADDCTDPDCEIHNPEVGREEGTVSDTDMAFWLAGYNRAKREAATAPRSGAEARETGRVEEYADAMLAKFLAQGISEEEAERLRASIVVRFGS